MDKISAIYIKAGGTGSWYEIRDSQARSDISCISSSSVLSSDIFFGVGQGGTDLELSVKGIPVGSVPISDLTSNQNLSDYYRKNETSSSEQISSALSGKSDLSAVLELSAAIDQKSSVFFVDWED